MLLPGNKISVYVSGIVFRCSGLAEFYSSLRLPESKFRLRFSSPAAPKLMNPFHRMGSYRNEGLRNQSEVRYIPDTDMMDDFEISFPASSHRQFLHILLALSSERTVMDAGSCKRWARQSEGQIQN